MNRAERVTRVLSLLLIVTVVGCLTISGNVLAASNFGQPTPGQHIYDKAGVLTTAQIANLEEHAKAVVAAGAPVVVYLQAMTASQSQTQQDAKDLMNAWDVQSAPNAHDGLVIFFNLNPNDLHHGQAALFAGAKHFDGGNLPEYELQRIFDQDMKPDLANGNLAQGIAVGLDAAANSLKNGPAPPPQPSALERHAADLSRGPLSLLNVVALLVTIIYGWFTLRVWRTRPRSFTPIAATLSPPDSTSPAVVGAVITGHVRDEQLEATVLDLAHRGALVIESEGKRNPTVRLIDPTIPNTDVEHKIWASLEIHADDQGVVDKANIARTRQNWSGARDSLRNQLEDSGLFDPTAKYRRRPVYLATVGMLVVGALAIAVTAIGKQPWGVLGATLIFVAAMTGFILMMLYPDTSSLGADLAAKWRSYVAGIKRAKSDRTLDVNLDLDEAMPYAVAAGVVSSLNHRLKQAAEQGYAPAWLGPAAYRSATGADAFYCWTAFHAAVAPSSSGGTSGGGAAAGGGGAGGSF